MNNNNNNKLIKEMKILDKNELKNHRELYENIDIVRKNLEAFYSNINIA